MRGRAIQRENPSYKIETVSKVYADVNQKRGPAWYDCENWEIPTRPPDGYEIAEWIGTGKYSDVFCGYKGSEKVACARLSNGRSLGWSRSRAWLHFFRRNSRCDNWTFHLLRLFSCDTCLWGLSFCWFFCDWRCAFRLLYNNFCLPPLAVPVWNVSDLSHIFLFKQIGKQEICQKRIQLWWVFSRHRKEWKRWKGTLRLAARFTSAREWKHKQEHRQNIFEMAFKVEALKGCSLSSYTRLISQSPSMRLSPTERRVSCTYDC